MRSRAGYNWDQPWCRCPRKWAYENIWSKFPLGGNRNFVLGTAIHKAMEAWYFPSSDSVGTRQLEALAAGRASLTSEIALYENLQQWEQDDLIMLESLLNGYFQRYPSEPFSIVGKPEAEFEYCLVCEHPAEDHSEVPTEDDPKARGACKHATCSCPRHEGYTGKIDLPVVQDGQHLIVEHKSSGLDPSTFLKTYQMSDQITGYVWAARCRYPKVAGAILNGLGKGRIAKTLGRATHWYQREPLIKQQRDLDRWRAMRLRIRKERAAQIEAWEQAGRPGLDKDTIFWMDTESCRDWNRDCSYLDVCLHHGEPNIVANFYTSERPGDHEPE